VDRPYRWAPAGILAAVASGAIVAIVGIARDEYHLHVQTADVTSGPISRRLLVSGTLEPARMVEVGSQVSGTITSLPVDFSSPVTAGQVIARLDPALFQTRLAEAEAGLARAQAERTRRLAALDDARMKLENAQPAGGAGRALSRTYGYAAGVGRRERRRSAWRSSGHGCRSPRERPAVAVNSLPSCPSTVAPNPGVRW
jgi:multidrug efflux pump subunit AcrA (membrane-fusion protein)